MLIFTTSIVSEKIYICSELVQWAYTVSMYSKNLAFKDRLGHLKREFFHDTKNTVSVIKVDGEKSYRPFGGFTDSLGEHRVKIKAEGITYDYPNYVSFQDGCLLGNWRDGKVYVVVPFIIMNHREKPNAI